MKNLIRHLKRQAQAYIDFRAQPAVDINLETHKIITTIEEAREKQLALHAVYKNDSFTGDLVKYNPKNDRLILKNLRRNISIIITINNIDRLTLVPLTVRKSQKLNKK